MLDGKEWVWYIKKTGLPVMLAEANNLTGKGEKMRPAIIFDMDGVLIDSERILQKVWRVCGERYRMKDMETTIYDCTGLNRADIRTYMLKKYGEDFAYDEFQKTSAAVLSEYLEKEPIPAKDGVYELLEYLKKEGYPIGLASSSRKVNVMTRIEEIHIESYFEKIITGDMVVHSKPDPEIYQIACSEMGVRPQDAIAIEDSPNGIKSAYAAGMKVIMVPDLVQPDADLLGMVWKLFDNLLEVKTYLEKESGQKA